MRWFFFIVVVIHGLIHFMGFAKAFGFAELPQLTQPVGPAMGVAWLVAGLLMLVAAALLLATPRLWWAVVLAALVLSQLVITAAWGDAKFGTIANVIVLLAAGYGFAVHGPYSFRAEYGKLVRARLAEPTTPRILTEADLAGLPEPVQSYLKQSGSVGQPQVHHFKAVWRGRIRGGPDDPWMPFTAEQYNFVNEPSRFFHLTASRSGIPVDGIHVFALGEATMRIKLLSLLPIVSAGGEEMTRAETVTLLNDMAIIAPSALLESAVRWEPIDSRSARALYSVGSNTVSAVLTFNASCELVGFVSDDRLVASPDGTRFTPMRWSTPITGYKRMGPYRVASCGEARWHPGAGDDYSYIELELVDLEVNGDWRARSSCL